MWQSEFKDAMGDWRESPALTLKAERVNLDYDCNLVNGVLVV